MFANLLDEFSGRGMSVVIGLLLGSVLTWLFARWKRMQEHRRILTGDARDTVVVHHHVVESFEVAAGPGIPGKRRVPGVMRIRSIGQAPLSSVVPNGHLAAVLTHRSFQVTPRDTLISMEGSEGSYLLETLTNFVCDRVANEPFEHDLYVMAPCCEPQQMASHQPITILLIAVNDLELFEDWNTCKSVRVEHGNDGSRILTLMEMARRYREERDKIAELRRLGKRARHIETMFILDLSLDKRAAPIETRSIPWGRFEHVLKQMELEA